MRLEKIDIFRWIAIIFMVLFHLNYSLVEIFWVNTLNFNDNFFYILWKISAFLFIFIAGFSAFLTYINNPQKSVKKYLKTSLKLAIFASLISIWTYFFMRNEYIRFWIIHFFAVSYLLLILFKRFWSYNILFWILAIIFWIFATPVINFKYLYFLWWTYPWFKSADFYPVLPYFWIILIWFWVWKILSKNNLLKIFELKNKNFLTNFLTFLWQHSLLIYLTHQIIIVLVLSLIFKI